MNYSQLTAQTKKVYPAILLDRIVSYQSRKKIRRNAFALAILLLITLAFASPLVPQFVVLFQTSVVALLCLYVWMHLLEAMYRSYFFKETLIDIRVLKILSTLKKKQDLTSIFLNHEMGQYTMFRLGFSPDDIVQFLNSKKDIVTISEFEIIENDDDKVSFAEFGFSLLHFDSDLAHELKTRGIQASDFKETLEWVARMDKKVRDRERWWTRDRLLRIPSIGKNLAFGQVYDLERFAHSITADPSFIQLGEKWRMHESSVNKMETVLSKQVGGNILLTSKDPHVAFDAVASLGKEIVRGTVLPAVEGKRIYVLDANLLLSTFENGTEFESMLNRILLQADRAGNVIIVIPDFSDFVENSHALNIDIKDLLSQILRSSNLHIIATSTDRSYHEVLETDIGLMSHFEKIKLAEFDEFQTINLLENEVLYLESSERVFFTYPAIKAIVDSADRYFADSPLLDKCLDIMSEVVSSVKKENKSLITQERVEELVSSKTGISLGKITREESSKLLHLKEEMKKRVIGQDEAIETIADAMLRARAGLADPKRPLGSFLFVGQTGVGKTETAKTLAHLFFGDEEYMLRSDMSEYSDMKALSRMIGTVDTPGVFASKVREKAHGVLLLDELEKASSQVHDLLLQILDEGYFTDARGDKVGMRNFIIIATSNAGSELIHRQDPAHPVTKNQITDHIILKKIFRTELLNRFDDVILFKSLESKQLNPIARSMVQKLADRLDQRGITLKETPELVTYLAQKGNDPRYGAREMNRVILKELESKIAQALVLGDLFEGDTIAFTNNHGVLEIQKYS